jgi:release factor glutamine methyltransferase
LTSYRRRPVSSQEKQQKTWIPAFAGMTVARNKGFRTDTNYFKPMTLAQALATLRDAFTPVAAEFALPEAERVLTFLLDCPRGRLYTGGDDQLPDETAGRIERIIARRTRDEPLAYILGSAYFYNREFAVTPAVLIPRPDTEVLVEEVLTNEPDARLRFLDLGTGSGCIAAILAQERPAWQCIAIDRSMPALAVAKMNRRSAFSLVCCDRLEAIKPNGLFDFIVSNPPYIPATAIPKLPGSVRGFEPLDALDGGVDGLDYYRYCADSAMVLLKKDGRIYCEIGYDQADAVMGIFCGRGWSDVIMRKDLGNQPRVVRALWPKGQGI